MPVNARHGSAADRSSTDFALGLARRGGPDRLRLRVGVVDLALAAALTVLSAWPVIGEPLPGGAPSQTRAEASSPATRCDPGFRLEGTTCKAVVVPPNAYPTDRTYGSGWECKRGYVASAGASACSPVAIPANAFLVDRGDAWECERGYRRTGDSCALVDVPENGFLTGTTYDTGWDCERGFRADFDRCVRIEVPENGHLSDAAYGKGWACERGFMAVGDACIPIVVPENAYLEPSYGRGWRCLRGFAETTDGCRAVEIPENAHLDFGGGRWVCDRPFRTVENSCVLPAQ